MLVVHYRQFIDSCSKNVNSDSGMTKIKKKYQYPVFRVILSVHVHSQPRNESKQHKNAGLSIDFGCINNNFSFIVR